MHKGKKYVDSAKTIDRSKQYEPADALSAVVSTANVGWPGSSPQTAIRRQPISG